MDLFMEGGYTSKYVRVSFPFHFPSAIFFVRAQVPVYLLSRYLHLVDLTLRSRQRACTYSSMLFNEVDVMRCFFLCL